MCYTNLLKYILLLWREKGNNFLLTINILQNKFNNTALQWKKMLILDVLNVIFNAEFKNPNKNDVTVPFLKTLEFMIFKKY